jgi:hypothetical protein
VAWLAARARPVPTLVGLDFPFAYAAPFLDHLRAPDFAALLARIGPLEGPPETGNCADAFITRCGRWWARWSQGEDHGRTRRHVERVATTRGAESPLRALPDGSGYRFVGPRQVGKAAITGIAALAALKARSRAVRGLALRGSGGSLGRGGRDLAAAGPGAWSKTTERRSAGGMVTRWGTAASGRPVLRRSPGLPITRSTRAGGSPERWVGSWPILGGAHCPGRRS